MGVSIIQEQHDIIIGTIKQITQGDWKVLVIDEYSKKIIDNVAQEDDILNQNVANIERIEERREKNETMDAIYILSPLPHIVDCLMADMEARRYRKSFLVWTGVLEPQLRRRVDASPLARQQIGGFETLAIDYFPKESNLVTFRDPWSFPILYHPACNALVAKHLKDLAQKITGLCVSLGEYPKVRFWRSRADTHVAVVLSAHLARFISEELDSYAQWNTEFPPPSSRPQAILLVTDRAMDTMAPLVHEFTYQAMAHDLLPIKEGDKTLYHVTVNEGEPDAEEKDMELSDQDKVWVDNRHRHMKDTIDNLKADFKKFLDQNPHFVNSTSTNLNAIKDMMAGLQQFQEMKAIYSLHLNMAQQCMNIFQRHKLPDISASEQTLATGLDDDYRKPKNVLESIVALLDDPATVPSDRLRLIILYVLYRDGVIRDDVHRLLAHAALPAQDAEVLLNLEHLGCRTIRGLKEPKRDLTPLFPIDVKKVQADEEDYLSRFQPALKPLLENLCKGVLDPATFPYVKPPLDPNEDAIAAQGSLRAAKPSWATSGRRVVENRQRIIVFMAGGATFSEARACYEVGNAMSRDIYLATSHMLTPRLYVRQLGDLSVDKRRLDLPADRPAPRAPAHLFERAKPVATVPPPRPAPLAQAPRSSGGPPPPTHSMNSLSLGGDSTRPSSANDARLGTPVSAPFPPASNAKPEKEKKKRNILGFKKSHG